MLIFIKLKDFVFPSFTKAKLMMDSVHKNSK